jgi:hypothetical protein
MKAFWSARQSPTLSLYGAAFQTPLIFCCRHSAKSGIQFSHHIPGFPPSIKIQNRGDGSRNGIILLYSFYLQILMLGCDGQIMEVCGMTSFDCTMVLQVLPESGRVASIKALAEIMKGLEWEDGACHVSRASQLGASRRNDGGLGSKVTRPPVSKSID